MRADDAWDALNAALDEYAPPCDGKALFTAESLTADQQELCESICGRCRVSDLCGAFADASKPNMGFWAGRRWSQAGKQAAGPRNRGGRPKRATG